MLIESDRRFQGTLPKVNNRPGLLVRRVEAGKKDRIGSAGRLECSGSIVYYSGQGFGI